MESEVALVVGVVIGAMSLFAVTLFTVAWMTNRPRGR
jgi:hypothetical protein